MASATLPPAVVAADPTTTAAALRAVRARRATRSLAVAAGLVAAVAALFVLTMMLGSFRLTAGASFRMVVDVGAWDNSRVVNTPGQSGNPSTPHYRDLFEAWRTGGYVPMPAAASSRWSRSCAASSTLLCRHSEAR